MLMLPNYYRATTSFYAASEDLAKPDPIGPVVYEKNYYGQDRDVDRLFSIAFSEELHSFLIDSFDLYKHYEIDPLQKEAKYKIIKRFRKLFSCLKTKYDAVELSMEDRDPVLAATLANTARNKINETAQGLVKRSQQQMISATKAKISEKENALKSLQDSLSSLKKQFRIYDLATQGEILMMQKTTSLANANKVSAQLNSLENNAVFADSIAYLKSLLSGYRAQVNQLNRDLELYNDGFGIVLALDKELNEFSKQLSIDKERLKQLEAGYNSKFPSLHLIQEATIPVKKSRPKRSLYVLAITILAAFAGMMISLVVESYKKINWKEVLDA